MNRSFLKQASLGLAVSALLFTAGCQNSEDAALTDGAEIVPTEGVGDVIAGQYLVKLNQNEFKPSRLGRTEFASREDKANYSEQAREQLEGQIKAFMVAEGLDQSKVSAIWTAAVTGFAAKLSDREVEVLRKNPLVDAVEPDVMLYPMSYVVDDKSGDEAAKAEAQTTPCGISNAGGPDTNGSAVSGAWAWIIDTGIDLDHPDLNVVTNSTYAKTFAGGTADDCNGHGTHVAGTVAAINNSYGVVGMVAGAPVVPVKVFGCSGGSSSSTIISGINHAASYDLPGDAANLSLGGYYGSGCSTNSTYRTAINNLANGSWVAIAAGNSSDNAALYQPACLNGSKIATVASMTCSKGWSSFSNYNMNPVDYIATGSSVYSTWPGGGYNSISGTSMATPHVAGIMMSRNAMPATNGSVYYNGEYYPIATR